MSCLPLRPLLLSLSCDSHPVKIDTCLRDPRWVELDQMLVGILYVTLRRLIGSTSLRSAPLPHHAVAVSNADRAALIPCTSMYVRFSRVIKVRKHRMT